MSCTSVFRIEASPMQFQAGRLYMCYEPYMNGRGARRANGAYLSQMTALHGVTYDPAKPAPVELRIPYAGLMSEYDLPLGQLETGRLHVFVMSPLNSASTTSTVTLSIQAWLEDVELSVPTAKAYATEPSRAHVPETTYGEPLEFQSSEAGMANKHVYSTALSRISKIATLMGHFPILASVAQPVAHFSSLASRVAAYFGFCKPPDVSAPTKVVSHNRAAWTNGDGALPIVKLAQSCENAVDQTQSYFHNPIDEMDISYIVSNLVALNQWAWSASDAVGKMITVIPVHPGLSVEVGTRGSYTFGSYMTTPLGYVSTMFKYWAGSIKYKLEAVSTPFHAGRLVVAYFPDYDPLAPTLNINEVGNQYSVVWDISDSSEILFEIPYLGNTPYLNCFIDDQASTTLINSETTGFGPRDRMRKVMNGAIVVFVLNQLVAPSAAADNVSIINWVAGGEDICFAEPTFGAYKPVATTTPVRNDMTQKWYNGATMSAPDWKTNPTRLEPVAEEEEISVELSFQSAPSGLTVTGIDPYSGATASRGAFRNFIPSKRISPQERAKLCQGEVITSLRPLIRRLTPAYELYPQNVTADGNWTGVAPNSQTALVLDPDYYGTGDGFADSAIYNKQIAPAVSGGANWLTELESAIKYVSWLYYYARGSRVYGISARPSNVINGAAFTMLGDEISLPTDMGTFDFRLSTLNEEDTPPRQPYFRPEDELLGYNYANTSSATLSASNYSYGFNSNLSGNMSVQKSGEAGCGIVVQVPPTTRYPMSLIATPDLAEASAIAYSKYLLPRSRRFLEIRYRAFSSSMSGTTANYRPKIWPFPLTIMESAADDFSFGGLAPPPVITKVQKTTVFVNYSTGARIAL